MRQHQPSRGTVWVYSYEIKPPQPRELFTKITALLLAEDRAAERAGRTWTAALISDKKDGPVTHVSIVSDTRSRDASANLALEAELHQLAVDIHVTVPRQVPRDKT